MEGSRHERVALIGATYVIGFVTAFNGFGVSQLEDTVDFVYVPTGAQSAALGHSAKLAPTSLIALREEGLYYQTSANSKGLLISAITEAGGDDGVAVAITQYELSPNEAFVYFCEQPTTLSDSCKPFVYSTKNDVVIPLTQNGQRIGVPNKPALLLWDEAGLVAIGDVVIDSITTP